ncbi:hypothetical protein RCO27_03415 [Sphingosinicella sp. LHD-64]|uniref:hypothetical protein n=1 Tax=Sphingosinicella sp. LHD-64 TaxID=3072139 RepID=UPI00280DD584|nr:hypothetical protein [Sphingosinicella sp. LHD-64]MDQ8755271.1 hypothetical protein [Sphingosinicella sp. LHD-64]
MNEARYASLSSGLLARKGTARPAMRPQGYTGFEDLGWNDMGQQAPVAADEPADFYPEHVPSSISALTPLPKGDEDQPVAAQRRAIAEHFDADEVEDEAPVEAAKPRKKAKVLALPQRPAVAAAPAGRKAAFTLRLDAERHLKLRLACAVTGRSAQQIVTGALDDFLASLPEVDALAERVPASAKRS